MVRTQKRDTSGSECLDHHRPWWGGRANADDRDCAETTDLAGNGAVDIYRYTTAAYYTLWASARDLGRQPVCGGQPYVRVR